MKLKDIFYKSAILIFLFSHFSINSTQCYAEKEKEEVLKVGYSWIDFSSMIIDISNAKVIYVGERHDNWSHHKVQLDVIKSLHNKGYSLAIGLEMFTNIEQHYLDRWVVGEIDEKEFIKAFYKNWGIGWSLYKDIFYYAKNNQIPLIGLNVPREITKKVAENGFQSLSKMERAKLPPGVSCDLDPMYMELLQRIFEIKRHSNRNFRNFCEAQVLWDQSMAWYLNQYIQKNPDKKIIVLSGNIHAWKYGIPRQLKRFNDLSQKVILQGEFDEFKNITRNEVDYLVIHK